MLTIFQRTLKPALREAYCAPNAPRNSLLKKTNQNQRNALRPRDEEDRLKAIDLTVTSKLDPEASLKHVAQ